MILGMVAWGLDCGGADRARSVTSGRNKEMQLQVYDPVLAGKQKVGNASRANGDPGPGDASRAKGRSATTPTTWILGPPTGYIEIQSK